MADSGDQLKSLKQFSEILEAYEADYRNFSTDDREVLMEDLMDRICERCEERGKTVPDRDALQKVCVCML